MEENKDYVVCQICGKKTTQINYAHLKMHGITGEQYKEMFPGYKMRIISENAKLAASRNMSTWNKSENSKLLVSNMFKGKSKSEEHKQALKEAKAREDKKLRAKINGDNRRGKPNKKKDNNDD